MEIYKRQCLLGALGYLTVGDQDGIDGPRTRAALERFCRDYQTDEDGLTAALAGTIEKTEPDKTGEFWDELRWFTREEFRCQCGGRYCDGYPAPMREEAVRIAEAAREHFGRPGHVVSGLRCEAWNAIQGGVPNSQHICGEAIDLRIDGVDAESLRRFVAAQPNHRYSYRINETNVHFDITRGGKNA